MRRRRLQFAALVAVSGLLAVVAAAAAGGGHNVREELIGYEEVPAVSTTGHGSLRALVRSDRIDYVLRYSDMEAPVTQAHIHLGADRTNGGISVFFCNDLPVPPSPAPPGTPACEGTTEGEVSGTLTADDVIGPEGQGIAPREFAELVRAIRAGVTYANVHSTKFPGGEVRGQIERGERRD